MVFFNQIKCFWKEHEKILIEACGSYFVRTYGISFIEKIKMLIFLSEFRFIFRHSNSNKIRAFHFLPPVCFC